PILLPHLPTPFFSFKPPATTDLSTLSLHDALPIFPEGAARDGAPPVVDALAPHRDAVGEEPFPAVLPRPGVRRRLPDARVELLPDPVPVREPLVDVGVRPRHGSLLASPCSRSAPGSRRRSR